MGCSSSSPTRGSCDDKLVPGHPFMQGLFSTESLIDLLDRHLGAGQRRWSIASATDPGIGRGFGSKTVRFLGDPVEAGRRGAGFACRKGLKPESPNQDSFMALHVDGHFSMYGVFDGHGKDGHEVSNFVKEQLPKLILRDSRCRASEMRAVLRDAFERVQEMIVAATRLNRMNARMSGTTATIVIHDHRERRLTVAHAGDSGVCLGRLCSKNARGFVAKPLTKDHKPNVEEERTRIENSGGRVLFDGYANHRVYTKTSRVPGLNMSRSLGDLVGASDAGITFEPTISEYQLGPEDHVLLMCSDGVWEFTSPTRAIEVVMEFEGSSAMMAADKLAKCAWDNWIREEGGSIVDDITALVVFLQPDRGQRAVAAVAAAAAAAAFAGACAPREAREDLVLAQVMNARPVVIGPQPRW